MGAREDISSMKRMNENEMVVLVRLGPEKEGITPGQITEEGVYFVYPFIVLNPIGNLLNL